MMDPPPPPGAEPEPAPGGGGVSVPENDSNQYVPAKDCCCCLCCDCCACADMWKESKGRVFCCCCPLRLGVWVISSVIFFLAFMWTFNAFLLIFNYYIDWIFIVGLFICFIPLYWAFVWSFKYIEARRKETRDKLKWACLLAIASIILVTIWTCVYYSNIYRPKYVYEGMGEPDDYPNYHVITRKQKITETIIVGIIWLSLFIYFFFV